MTRAKDDLAEVRANYQTLLDAIVVEIHRRQTAEKALLDLREGIAKLLTPEIGRRGLGYTAAELLVKVVDLTEPKPTTADAFMDQPVSEEERETIARKHRRLPKPTTEKGAAE